MGGQDRSIYPRPTLTPGGFSILLHLPAGCVIFIFETDSQQIIGIAAMDEMDALRTELEHYKAEKEKIRDVVGQIGGRGHLRRLPTVLSRTYRYTRSA